MNIFILTGSIATGKSNTLNQLERLGFKTLNADKIVHQLLGKNGVAVRKVAALFPEALLTEKNVPSIDRKVLGNIVFNDAKKLKQLEQILHPLVRKAEQKWLRKQRRLGTKNVVIEIPLYFESRWKMRETNKHKVIVTSASAFIMKRRAHLRPNMTQGKLHQILKRQWPNIKKQAYADMIIHTGLGNANAFRQLRTISHSRG